VLNATAPALSAADPLDEAMRRVDEVIRERLASRVALVNQISQYIVGAGGKRIRPRLVLLFAEALGFDGPERHELAAIVEFIHTATLLHDDVVDESALRRGRATANAIFGNAASVLVGDFLYSRAFQMMVSVDRMRVLQVLADATNVIAEGEVLQLMNMHDPDLAVDDYLQVIRFKTAKLFEASARLGAVLANASPWAPPSSSSMTCSTTKATATNSARTSATTFARASRLFHCCWPWSGRRRRSAPACVRPSSSAAKIDSRKSWPSCVARAPWRPRGRLHKPRPMRRGACSSCCRLRELAKLC
jgi:hypothetical protein